MKLAKRTPNSFLSESVFLLELKSWRKKMSSSLKFGLQKVEKGRVYFSVFVRLSSALLKRIPRLFPLTTLRFTSRSGL